MQLILPQSELEQAIKNYVNDLMNVKDGTELHIDLKAGRGVDGFTATVDIIKAGSNVPAKTVVPTATATAVIPAAAAVLKVTARAVVQEEITPKAEPVKVQESVPVEVAVEVKSEQPEAATQGQIEEAAPAEATTSVRRPLFGNLKKPE